MSSKMERFVTRVADILIGKRKILAVVFAVITVLFAASATRIKLDPGFLKLLPIKHEYMRTMMEYMKDFSGANTLLVNLRWKGEGDIYNKEFMEALQKATDEVFYIPGVNRTKVSSLFTPSTYYIEITESGFNGEPVVPARYSGTPEQLAQVRKNVALSGQIGLIVSNDQKSAMIRADLQDYDASKGQDEQRVDYWKVQEKLTEIREKFEKGNVEVNIIGFARLLGDVIYGLLGVFIFFGVAFLITMALLFWYTRSLRLTVVALVVALLPVLWLIGTLPLIGFGIDPMSILVPFLIFSIGVSHAVQMTNAWRQEVVAGKTPVEASHASFCKLFIPGAVALLTNALGFAVIMFIDIPIVHELGITACIGVLLMIATNKMILPIILTRVKLEESSRQHSLKGPSSFMAGVWKALAKCAEPKTAVTVFVVCAVLLLVSTIASRKLVIGDSGKGVPELRYDSRYNYDDRAINSNYNIGTDVLTIIAEAKNFEGDSCLHYEVVDLIDRLELYVRG
ncbi:MAG: efflux RND transporter permease subunit, partial [Solimonas sp.]